MGDKSPKSKQKSQAQKTAVKVQDASKAKSKQSTAQVTPAKGGKK